MALVTNYSVVSMAVVLVVMLGQFYKIQVLNTEMRKQIAKFETMRRSLREDVTYCEQRTANCNADLEREVAAKVDFGKKRIRAEDVAARMRKDLERIQYDTQQEKLNLQATTREAERKMKAALADVEAITKERDDAKKEIDKYHTLYLNGNKLLTSVREECEKLKASAAAVQAINRQVIGAQVNNDAPAIARESKVIGRNAGRDMNVQQREQNPGPDINIQQRDLQHNRTPEKRSMQEQPQNEEKEREEQIESGKKVEREAKKDEEVVKKKTNERRNAEVITKRIEAKKEEEVVEEEEEEEETDNMREKASRK